MVWFMGRCHGALQCCLWAPSFVRALQQGVLKPQRMHCCAAGVVFVLLQLWLCLTSHRDRTLQAAVAGATSHRRSRSSTTGLAVTASGGAGTRAKPLTHKQQRQLGRAAAVAAMAAAVYLPYPARHGRPAEVARWGLLLLLCVSWSGGR